MNWISSTNHTCYAISEREDLVVCPTWWQLSSYFLSHRVSKVKNHQIQACEWCQFRFLNVCQLLLKLDSDSSLREAQHPVPWWFKRKIRGLRGTQTWTWQNCKPLHTVELYFLCSNSHSLALCFNFKVENVSISVEMPKTVLNMNMTVSQGRYTFDSVKRTLSWEVGRIDPTKIPSIRGNVKICITFGFELNEPELTWAFYSWS